MDSLIEPIFKQNHLFEDVENAIGVEYEVETIYAKRINRNNITEYLVSVQEKVLQKWAKFYFV